MRAVILLTLVAVAVARTAYFCEIAFQAPSDLTSPSFQSSYILEDFNAMSFGDFRSSSGDTEGRLAVAGNMDVTTYSVGYELRTGGQNAWDNSRGASLVVGGDLAFRGGAVYPLGNNYPYMGTVETIRASTFSNTPSYISDIISAPAAGVAADFTAAQAYFTRVSDIFAGLSDTTAATVAYVDNAARITCTGISDVYVVSLIDTSLANVGTVEIVGCPADAQYIFNIRGTGAVKIPSETTSSQALKIERVVFNVVGSGSSRPVSANSVTGSVLAPSSSLTQTTGVIRGFVIVGNVAASNQINRVHCQPPTPDVVPACVSFESCAELAFTLAGNSMNFQEFNAISFGSFSADTGDIEGRLAVANDVTLGAGYSVGYELQTTSAGPHIHQAFSLVVGGDLTWVSGSLHPDGSGTPYLGAQENAYVAGTVNSFLSSDRVTQGSDISSIFAAAHECYKNTSRDLAALSDNVAKTVADSAISITCADASATTYVVSLTAADFAASTYTILGNCNFQAQWIINIRGNNDVTISGGSFPSIPTSTIYNVVSAGTVTVRDTQVNGHFIAPLSTLNQVNGVIIGKVVANDITFSLQINQASTCEEDLPVVMYVVAAVSASAGSTQIQIVNVNMVRVNDVTSAGTIIRIDGDVITVDTPLTRDVSAGNVVGTLRLSSYAGRGQVPNPADDSSSASVVATAFASIVVAALLI